MSSGNAETTLMTRGAAPEDDGTAVGLGWPALPLAEWEGTRDTLHLWTQVVGKVRLAVEPRRNHWWHVPLYVSARGLTSSLVNHPATPFEMTFDFRRAQLSIETVTGEEVRVGLYPRSVADFHANVMAALGELGLGDIKVDPHPVEVEESIPFPDDHVHDTYDATKARRFWEALVQLDGVLKRFAGGFDGKSSPVHFFWGSFDLAQTRFSGRPAPLHPGGVPNCPDWVMQEAYRCEVSSGGFWPGGASEGVVYAYAYPEPPGYRDAPVWPPGAAYSDRLHEFVLPYSQVREAPDPAGLVLEFLESTAKAAADLGGWDRGLDIPEGLR